MHYSLRSQTDASRVLARVISQLNSHSKLQIAEGFVVSSKTGAGIEKLKAALERMVPAQVVPSSYEKLLTELRSQSTATKNPFLMAEDAQLLARSKNVRSYTKNALNHAHPHHLVHSCQLSNSVVSLRLCPRSQNLGAVFALCVEGKNAMCVCT